MEIVGTLAGGIAHDFNNVLAGVLGTASVLKLKIKNKKIDLDGVQKYIQIISDSGERATSMVQQLLSISKKQETNLTPVDLNNSVKNVVKLCRNSFHKSIRINESYSIDPAKISADENQIEQVILNICLNSSHAMTIMKTENAMMGGNLTITISKFTIDKTFIATHSDPNTKEGDYWKLTIQDDGVGIKKEILPQIFNPFFTTKKKGEGTGLGLSMIYNIIKQHKGLIDVHSEFGLGTTFSIYLPSTSKNLLVEDDEVSTELKDSGLVLIIDDEKIIRDSASDMLLEIGYEVIVATNGREGIEQFNKYKNDIKFILLDMVMPEMSGKEAFIEIKKIKKDTKIILSSGFKQDQKVEDILELGVDGFIQKPYKYETLSEKIIEVLKNS